jgi:hypothetical protein
MKLALWLMQRFGVGDRNPSLLGDITEEWSRNRSVLWLLLQTVVAIVMTLCSDVRQGWLRAIVAIAAAGGVYWLGLFLVTEKIMPLHLGVLPDVSIVLLVAGMSGATAALLNRAQPLGTAVLFMAAFAFVSAYNLWSQWSQWPRTFWSLIAFGVISQSVVLGAILAGALLVRRSSATRVPLTR